MYDIVPITVCIIIVYLLYGQPMGHGKRQDILCALDRQSVSHSGVKTSGGNVCPTVTVSSLLCLELVASVKEVK